MITQLHIPSSVLTDEYQSRVLLLARQLAMITNQHSSEKNFRKLIGECLNHGTLGLYVKGTLQEKYQLHEDYYSKAVKELRTLFNSIKLIHVK